MADFITHFSIIEDPRIERCKKHKLLDIIAVRLRPNKKVQNLGEMWYKCFAKHTATQGDFGLESP